MLELEKLKNAEKVVGTRRLLRAIAAGEVSEAYLAMDADLFIARQVREACEKAGVRLVEASSMKALGQACGRPKAIPKGPQTTQEVLLYHADDQSVDPQG